MQGPRMVRDVFRLAKENEPAIIFIDEVGAAMPCTDVRHNALAADV